MKSGLMSMCEIQGVVLMKRELTGRDEEGGTRHWDRPNPHQREDRNPPLAHSRKLNLHPTHGQSEPNCSYKTRASSD